MPAPYDTFTILGTPSEWARAAAWADECDEVPDVHGSIEEIPVPFYDVVFAGGHTHLPGYLHDAHTRRAPLRGLPRPVPPEVLRREQLDHLALSERRR